MDLLVHLSSGVMTFTLFLSFVVLMLKMSPGFPGTAAPLVVRTHDETPSNHFSL